jgi:hypothetical protein
MGIFSVGKSKEESDVEILRAERNALFCREMTGKKGGYFSQIVLKISLHNI